MAKRVEIGELTYVPRLEKTVKHLLHMLTSYLKGRTCNEDDVCYEFAINSYADMGIRAFVDENEDDEDDNGQYPIRGHNYYIEINNIILCTVYMKFEDDPSVIVKNLLEELEKYDLTKLFPCEHCMHTFLKKGETACQICERAKIVYKEMCAICHDDHFSAEESVWCKLDCDHVFHKHCILQICNCNHCKIKCPLCRNESIHRTI